MTIPNVTEFLDTFKANSEKVKNLEAEKLTLENDFKTQADLVASLQKENTTHSEALVNAQAELSARDLKITDYEKTIAEFNQAIADAEKAKTSAALEAKKIVASIGVTAVPTIKNGSEETKNATHKAVLEEYNSMDSALRFSFFEKNKDAILNS